MTASLSSSLVKDLADQVFRRYGFTYDPDGPNAIEDCDFADPAVPGTMFTCRYALPDGRTATAQAKVTDDLFYEVVDITASEEAVLELGADGLAGARFGMSEGQASAALQPLFGCA